MFVLTQTLKLDEFEGWQGCYIKFNSPCMEDIERAEFSVDDDTKVATEKQNKFLEKFFVEGLGWNGKEKITLKAGDIVKLPMVIYTKCVSFLLAMSSAKTTTQN